MEHAQVDAGLVVDPAGSVVLLLPAEWLRLPGLVGQEESLGCFARLSVFYQLKESLSLRLSISFCSGRSMIVIT